MRIASYGLLIEYLENLQHAGDELQNPAQLQFYVDLKDLISTQMTKL